MSLSPLASTPFVDLGPGFDPDPPASDTVTVQRGDTLSGIAKTLGVTTAELIAANPQIDNPDLIYPGQKINVPPGTRGDVDKTPSTPKDIPVGPEQNRDSSPGLEAAKARLQALEAHPPQRSDYPGGFFGDILYSGAVSAYGDKVDLAHTEVEYEGLKLNAPQRSEYPSGKIFDGFYEHAKAQYQARIAPYQEKLGPVLLDRFEAQATATSPTSAKIIAEARRLGQPVTVLSDAEYTKRFPGTGGVTTGGTVYVPASALEDPNNGVLVHELTHGILGHHEGIYDTSRPIDDRISEARTLFTEIGLNPDDGERLVRVTDGWGQGEDSDHVQTYVESVDIARERANLPPLSATQRDDLYAQTAEREAALEVQRKPLKDIDSKSPAEQKKLLADAEKQWARTAQGRANPPTGNTFEERLASLRGILDRFASEDRLLHFKTE